MTEILDRHCRHGIVAKINQAVIAHSGQAVDYEILEMIVEAIEQANFIIFAKLADWAFDEIRKARRDELAAKDDEIVGVVRDIAAEANGG